MEASIIPKINLETALDEMFDQYQVSTETRQFLGKHQQIYIDGEFVDCASGERLVTIEPATEEVITTVPSCGPADVDRAVAAARRALECGEWAEMKPNERQGVLFKLADLMEENARTLAEIETIENGKAITGCHEADVMGSVDFLRYMAGWATKIEGATRSISAPGQTFAYTVKEPVGVVGAIVPWNFPLNTAIWKIAAPLAAGCTIVMKPSELTSLSTLYLAELSEKAGLPKGVLNVVTGYGDPVGSRLASHPGVDKVSFTGSTRSGRLVGHAAIDDMKHLTLELGGKSPMIVFEDADVDAVAQWTLNSVYFNTGQVCSAGTRLYVHDSLYDRMVTAVKRVAEQIKVGPGLDPNTEMGPVISAGARESILEYVRKGIEQGAELITGGKAIPGPGFFVEPTLLGNCRNDNICVQEEIFGPVLTVSRFDSEEEVIQMANDNIYGLAASIWTRDLSRALRVIPRIKAGSVYVNNHDTLDSAMPFGGYKQSGFGKDLGPEQLDHYLETKSVIMNL